jgi:hypothetical protein
MNTIKPIAIDIKVTNSVAAAEISLTFLALTEYSNETISTTDSIAVLMISNPITKPIATVTAIQSCSDNENTKPKTTTITVAKR